MKTSYAQFIIGLLITAVGFGFLLQAFGIIEFGKFAADWWPLLIVAVGVASLLSNPRAFAWPLTIVTAGILLQLNQLGIKIPTPNQDVELTFSAIFWPAILMFVGLSFIFNRFGSSVKKIDEDVSKMSVLFSGIEARNHSDDYKGGKITAVFGGIDLDLREATIKGKTRLDVFVAFGGAELKVPEGWIVNVSGVPILGGWENKTRKPADKNAPVLNINATCAFGGIEVKN